MANTLNVIKGMFTVAGEQPTVVILVHDDYDAQFMRSSSSAESVQAYEDTTSDQLIYDIVQFDEFGDIPNVLMLDGECEDGRAGTMYNVNWDRINLTGFSFDKPVGTQRVFVPFNW